MIQNEPFELRCEMATMHDFFLKKINESIEGELYFEAAWLIYSCLENRFFRVLDKYKRECKYCTKGGKCRKGSNQLAISTKVNCVERLHKAKVECISESFSNEILDEVKKWIKLRNNLMHNLLSLEHYEDHFDNDFKNLALNGKRIVEDVYEACAKFRESYFRPDYEFVFPESCMEECPCKPRNQKEG